mmetsp:Transcript_35692/g.31488  ORF Transcript_35692/g.31488 Transcript_35692/m.31488 type:complete len:92 (-) Transcript_35692:82-357(-)
MNSLDLFLFTLIITILDQLSLKMNRIFILSLVLLAVILTVNGFKCGNSCSSDTDCAYLSSFQNKEDDKVSYCCNQCCGTKSCNQHNACGIC